jgi:large subunit ribosomal protein L14
MLFTESMLKAADNAGPKTVKCIKGLKNYGNRKVMRLGDEIIVAVQKKKVQFKKRKLDKKVFFALIISTRAKTKRLGGVFVKFSLNRSLLLNEEYRYLGTRVYGPICKEIRDTKVKELKYKRIISYSGYTV